MDHFGYVSAHFTLVYFKHFRHTKNLFLTRCYFPGASLRYRPPAG
jgi:hypothetical protein